MDPANTLLLAAAIAFVGTHFALSHPLRAPLVGAVGETGFMGVYSLVSLATFVWMVMEFRAAPEGDLPGSGEIGWIVATVLTLPALVLFLGSLVKNPAMPNPKAPTTIDRAPTGAFAVTRHPMMWGFALWGIAHIVLWWDVRTLIVAVAITFLALVGAHMQDRKKEALLGDAWAGWEARTSYWPQWGNLLSAGWGLWLAGLVLWLAVTFAHMPGAGIAAGIWRWF
ncbi:NnrU family protein [Tsuneonella mangrovi]|uniref:NnrU family protein n=1 Tax=Tsuneonella mangrovi TaxID=1982042 RepID=UPI000BA24687|nr:NnrU family protein [Tsuneonella mangrovi]